MILFVSGATRTVSRYTSPHLGWFVTPRNRTNVAQVIASCRPWAADNGCYHRFNAAAYQRMLQRIAAVDQTHLVFVTAPDVVADAHATCCLFHEWLPILRAHKLPVAFVAQDGQEDMSMPWDDIVAVFIGGSTAWKESVHAARLIIKAKQHGKWVHVGRVSSLRRARLMGAFGADSIDSSAFSRFPNKYVPWMLRHLPYRQQAIKEALC